MAVNQESSNEFRAIRESTGLSRGVFCKTFGIPLRTVQDWENGVRTPPSYVKTFLVELIKFKGLNVKDQDKK